MRTPSREALALAADLPLSEALALYPKVAPWMGWAKVGLRLFIEHGPEAVRAFQALGARVFLDLKLHDIPNTVQLASRAAGALGVGLLTVHAAGGSEMIAAAVEGAAEGAREGGHAPPGVLAVTVLTSTGALEGRDLAEEVERLASLSVEAGAVGVVCAASEAASVRTLLGPRAFICTPGIRPVGTARGDQARVQTPEAAWASGSDLLVVGRPIYQAPAPDDTARALLTSLGFAD